MMLSKVVDEKRRREASGSGSGNAQRKENGRGHGLGNKPCSFRDKVFGVVVVIPKHLVGDFMQQCLLTPDF